MIQYLLKQLHLQHKFGNNIAKEYGEDMCMKAVNQSIGRVIRHINDYAVIVLADKRYCKASVQLKLPKWISSRIVSKISQLSFGQSLCQINQFIARKKTQQNQIENQRKMNLLKK